MATLSILGLWMRNEHLFDELQLPEGVDKDNLIGVLLEETAELEVLYSDAEYMQWSIGNFSKMKLPSWIKMKKALEIEYDGTDNYLRKIKINGSDIKHQTANSSSTNNSTSFTTSFDSANWLNDDKVDSTNSSDGTMQEELTKEHNTTLSGTGNIQNTIEKELYLRSKYNIILNIVRDLKDYYCLKVY